MLYFPLHRFLFSMYLTKYSYMFYFVACDLNYVIAVPWEYQAKFIVDNYPILSNYSLIASTGKSLLSNSVVTKYSALPK